MRTIMKMLTVLGGGGVATLSLLDNLGVWLDANDASTLFQMSDGTVPAVANADPIGYWGDKSGNGRHATQGTAGSKPSLKTNAIGGKNAIDPDGGDNLSITLSLPSGSFMLYAVIDLVAGDLNSQPHYLIDSETGRLIFGFSASAGLENEWAWFDGAFHAPGEDESASQQIVVWRLESGGNGQIWRNNTSLGTAAYTSTAFGGATRIFSHNTGTTTFLNSPVAELILYTGVHTDVQRQQVQNYLASKWSITLA